MTIDLFTCTMEIPLRDRKMMMMIMIIYVLIPSFCKHDDSYLHTHYDNDYYFLFSMFLIPRLRLVCLGRGLVGYWKGYFNHKRSRRRLSIGN